MIDGLPNWRRGEAFPESQDILVLVMAGKRGSIRYYLAHWRWHCPWFKPHRKVWFGHYGIVRDPIAWIPVGELFKLPTDLRSIAEIESDLAALTDQQSASAVRGNDKDAAI